MRICVIIAPNDRYNYGDLLFSHVLKTKLGCYYNEFVDIATIDADLSVFGGHKVYSINKIKEHTKNRNFDVILAGGHSLFCPWPFVLFCLNNKYAWLSKFNILLSKLLDRNKSKSITNCISRLVFGAKTKYPYSIGKYEIDGIRKIIYNSVDGNLDATLNKEDKRLLKSIDYLSVRNNTTCNQLKENGIQVYSYPDSAIQISQIFPIVDLLKMTSINRDYFKKSYIVFQINRGLGERSFSAIVENIKQIINHYDYKIYLCPIGLRKDMMI